MGTKYSAQSISGYDASPPADDGSKVESNVLEWDKHKTKLGDPIKTLAEDINTALIDHFDVGPDAKVSGYSVGAADYGKTIEVDAASATVSLLAAATAGAGFHCKIKNRNATTLTVDVSGGGTIDGGTSVVLDQYESISVMVNDAADDYMLMADNTKRRVAAYSTVADSTISTTEAMEGNVTLVIPAHWNTYDLECLAGGYATVTGTLTSNRTCTFRWRETNAVGTQISIQQSVLRGDGNDRVPFSIFGYQTGETSTGSRVLAFTSQMGGNSGNATHTNFVIRAAAYRLT